MRYHSLGQIPQKRHVQFRDPEASGDNGSAREVREWARANGHQVSDRGRVPAEVMEAYRACVDGPG